VDWPLTTCIWQTWNGDMPHYNSRLFAMCHMSTCGVFVILKYWKKVQTPTSIGWMKWQISKWGTCQLANL
jgi:hypothetical protein